LNAREATLDGDLAAAKRANEEVWAANAQGVQKIAEMGVGALNRKIAKMNERDFGSPTFGFKA
jgi:hypothetical protein